MNVEFYLIFLVILLEFVKITYRNLRKSNKLFITELGILLLALIVISYSMTGALLIFPILLLIIVTIDYIEVHNKTKNLLILKITLVLSLIAAGIYYIIRVI